MKKEIWKDIKGYEGYYRISNLGRILGVKRSRIRKPTKLIKNESVYLTINLRKEGTQKTFRLSHLVYSHFISEIFDMIDHKDGDMLNCRSDNLISVKTTFRFKKNGCSVRIIDTSNMAMYDSIPQLAEHLGIKAGTLREGLRRNFPKYSHFKKI